MPKTIHNSTRCSCCHRLMPRKTGKRKTCSPQCAYQIRKRAKHAGRYRRLLARLELMRRSEAGGGSTMHGPPTDWDSASSS